MSQRRKCFLGCVQQGNQQLTLFGFPVKNVDRCAIWIKALNLNYDVNSMRKDYLCHQHFPADCFHSRMHPEQRLILQSNAIPTIKKVCFFQYYL